MRSVRVDEAEHFYEEDEDPKEVFAAFDAAEKGRTAPPDTKHAVKRRQTRLQHVFAEAVQSLSKLMDLLHAWTR